MRTCRAPSGLVALGRLRPAARRRHPCRLSRPVPGRLRPKRPRWAPLRSAQVLADRRLGRVRPATRHRGLRPRREEDRRGAPALRRFPPPKKSRLGRPREQDDLSLSLSQNRARQSQRLARQEEPRNRTGWRHRHRARRGERAKITAGFAPAPRLRSAVSQASAAFRFPRAGAYAPAETRTSGQDANNRTVATTTARHTHARKPPPRERKNRTNTRKSKKRRKTHPTSHRRTPKRTRTGVRYTQARYYFTCRHRVHKRPTRRLPQWQDCA